MLSEGAAALRGAWAGAKRLSRLLAAGAWAGAFRARGLLGSGGRAAWLSPGGLRVLALAPHPDDEIGCGGTLLRHRRCGDAVLIVYATDGRRSRALGLGPAEMSRRRHGEALAAAAILASEPPAWLGLPEGEWRREELIGALAGLLAAWRPDLIYAPSRIDFHPEHWRVAECLAAALGRLGDQPPPALRIYQIQTPLTGGLANLAAPIGSVLERQRAAAAAYVSQQGSIARLVRLRRYAAARRPWAAPEAEEFWQLSAAQYRALHAGSPADWRALRGLRAHPASDPLAYLLGRRERARLRRLALEGGGDAR